MASVLGEQLNLAGVLFNSLPGGILAGSGDCGHSFLGGWICIMTSGQNQEARPSGSLDGGDSLSVEGARGWQRKSAERDGTVRERQLFSDDLMVR